MTQQPLRVFSQQDSPADALVGQGVSVVGYGNLGRAFALNLRDDGVDPLTIGNVADDYALAAKNDGVHVQRIAEAARAADVVLMLLPDEVIPEVFQGDVAPNLKEGSAVVFASGYCLAYGLVTPPPTIDVLLLAPRMGGEAIRQRYCDGDGFHAFVSVERESSGAAWQRLLGLARAVGALRVGAFELSAKNEAFLDLFIEQTLGAIVGFSVVSAFSIGVEQGLPPEALALEMYLSGEMETA